MASDSSLPGAAAAPPRLSPCAGTAALPCHGTGATPGHGQKRRKRCEFPSHSEALKTEFGYGLKHVWSIKHVETRCKLPKSSKYFNYELGSRHRVKPAQTLAAGASGDGRRQRFLRTFPGLSEFPSDFPWCYAVPCFFLCKVFSQYILNISQYIQVPISDLWVCLGPKVESNWSVR